MSFSFILYSCKSYLSQKEEHKQQVIEYELPMYLFEHERNEQSRKQNYITKFLVVYYFYHVLLK
jgi:hypothetical protein